MAITYLIRCVHLSDSDDTGIKNICIITFRLSEKASDGISRMNIFV